MLLLANSPAALPALVHAQSARSSSVELRNKAIIQDAFECWARGGGTFYDDLLAPDMTRTIVGTGFGAGTHHGRETFKQNVIAPFTALLATPIQPAIENIWADGDHVIVAWWLVPLPV